ncbi:metal ABC transporter solute-binding protein, Zn/Mn family [Vreelandella olivaria]|uniref:metal ABC transporter solute-binding protein, Zn/Mn family n=1 Tax=Vreelandella olivaria TaxID=390919 RepID=UPI00201F5569|nr:zinc ABC transporter substrate-binding protein [Halomonas olivaria]
MDKRAIWVIALLFITLVTSPQAFAASSLKVIVSFSVIEDLVKRVAGNDVRITTIVPIGEDVHRWELTPPNVLAIEEADIIFYNGFGLEPWIRHVEAMADDGLTLTALAEKADYTPLAIMTGQYKGSPDPHMWMDPKGAAAYIDVIAQTLIEHYPEKAEAFNARAEEAHEALALLDQRLQERLQGIPQTNRVLYTSEAGMSYFAQAYQFEYASIWGVNHETLGSAQAMESMSRRLTEKRPPALFYESTVPFIHMDSLARETGIKLGGPLYVDTLGEPDGPAYNYPAMLRHNAEQLHEALGGARAE